MSTTLSFFVLCIHYSIVSSVYCSMGLLQYRFVWYVSTTVSYAAVCVEQEYTAHDEDFDDDYVEQDDHIVKKILGHRPNPRSPVGLSSGSASKDMGR